MCPVVSIVLIVVALFILRTPKNAHLKYIYRSAILSVNTAAECNVITTSASESNIMSVCMAEMSAVETATYKQRFTQQQKYC